MLTAPATIRTKRLRAPASPEDGTRILIVRWPPEVPAGRETWHLEEPDLSPSATLLGEARRRGFSEETWRWYAPRFWEEMKGRFAQEALLRVEGLVRAGRTVTLLCFCASEGRCHRGLVRKMLEEVLRGR